MTRLIFIEGVSGVGKRRQMQILALLPVRAHHIDVSDENWPSALKRMIAMLDGGKLCL